MVVYNPSSSSTPLPTSLPASRQSIFRRILAKEPSSPWNDRNFVAPPEKPHVDKQDLQKKKVAPVGGMFVGKPWSSSSCSEAEQPPKKSQVLKDAERNHYLLQRLWQTHWSRIAPRLQKKRPAGKPACKKTAAVLHPTKAKTPKGKKDQKGTKDMSQAPGPAAASK